MSAAAEVAAAAVDEEGAEDAEDPDVEDAEEGDADEAADAASAAAAAATTSEPWREPGSGAATGPQEAVAPRAEERPERVEGMTPAVDVGGG